MEFSGEQVGVLGLGYVGIPLAMRMAEVGLQVIGFDVLPEREDPGNANFNTRTIPKVVDGHTPSCLEAGIALYSRFIDKVVPVSSTWAAEMVKLPDQERKTRLTQLFIFLGPPLRSQQIEGCHDRLGLVNQMHRVPLQKLRRYRRQELLRDHHAALALLGEYRIQLPSE